MWFYSDKVELVKDLDPSTYRIVDMGGHTEIWVGVDEGDEGFRVDDQWVLHTEDPLME